MSWRAIQIRGTAKLFHKQQIKSPTTKRVDYYYDSYYYCTKKGQTQKNEPCIPNSLYQTMPSYPKQKPILPDPLFLVLLVDKNPELP